MGVDSQGDLVYVYPNGATALSSTAVKLLPDMDGSTPRYLVPDQRDFFAVTLR